MPENTTIVEMRTYTAHVGQAAAFVALYREKGLPIQEPIQGGLLGMYRTEFGPMNQIVLLWEYPDQRNARRPPRRTPPGARLDGFPARSRPADPERREPAAPAGVRKLASGAYCGKPGAHGSGQPQHNDRPDAAPESGQ